MSDAISMTLSATQLAHTKNCFERVKQEINTHDGSLGFDQFMEIVLYDPSVGYYCHHELIWHRHVPNKKPGEQIFQVLL